MIQKSKVLNSLHEHLLKKGVKLLTLYRLPENRIKFQRKTNNSITESSNFVVLNNLQQECVALY